MQYQLRQNLARTTSGEFVFINAWNEWGEGAVLEPSMEWGRRWLEAVSQAVREEEQGHVATLNSEGYASSVPLTASGVSSQHISNAAVCIIVRASSEYVHGTFNIEQTLSSLKMLEHRNWRAFVVPLDFSSTSVTGVEVANLVEKQDDKRIQYVDPFPFSSPLEEKLVNYHEKLCTENSIDFEWGMIVDAPNWYRPDALNFLPSEVDGVLLNYFSVLQVHSSFLRTRLPATNSCCRRFNNFKCTPHFPSPDHAFSMQGFIFRAAKFKADFGHLSRTCIASKGCESAYEIANIMQQALWSLATLPLDVCPVYINPSPLSCGLLGAVWYDNVNDTNASGCNDIADMSSDYPSINWENFIDSDHACFCNRTTISS